MTDQLHVLYRFFDSDGKLLYIGITNNPQRRFQNHRATKPWFAEVAHSTMEYYSSRDDLAAAEAAAIMAELPKYNGAYMPVCQLAEGVRRSGRPEVGAAVNFRLGAELLALVDDYAAHNGYKRAEAIRFLLDVALSKRHGSESSGVTR